MKLTYIPKPGTSCPGEGWPAADHDEPDEGLARQKIASGFYRGPNSKEQREAERAQAAAKKAVNQKAQTRITDEIGAADEAVTEATQEAVETRKRLGREAAPATGRVPRGHPREE